MCYAIAATLSILSSYLEDLLIFVIFCAIGAAYIKWPRIWQALRFPCNSSWPIFPAVVRRQLVRSRWGRGKWIYQVELGYDYQVGGEYYSGYYKGDLYLSEAEANAVIEQYPVGTACRLAFIPENRKRRYCAFEWDTTYRIFPLKLLLKHS
jgi:hypothetical protein